MQLPEWLYESLPLLYVAGGWACLLSLGDRGQGQFSALLLFAVAFRVATWRRSARSRTPGCTGFHLLAR